MRPPFAIWLTVLLTAATAAHALAGNWPAWRGPAMTGVAAATDLPLRWSDQENVRWRVALPGPGNSSPIVWGNRVFLTQAVQPEHRRTLLCFDRADGKLLWQSGVTYTENEPTQESNPYCSGSPTTDGERVYVCFGSAGVFAYDFAGQEVWHRDLGRLTHRFGNAISPILHADLCLLNFGPDEKARLIALDTKTGETKWEVEPPKPDPAERASGAPSGPGGLGDPGSPGGRGGFGPGMFLAPQMMSQADKDGDKQVTQTEFTALADAWFDKLDPAKTGTLSQGQFSEKLNELLPAPQGTAPPAGVPPGGGRGLGPAGFAGRGIFTVADADRDGLLTRSELKQTFEKWYGTWDPGKTGSLDEPKLRDGLNAALPRPSPGGPGGPGGRAAFGGSPSGSWSTPLILEAGARTELVVSFPARLVAYDPGTGKQLWFSKGLGETVYASPLWGDGVLVGMSGGPSGGIAIAVKPGGAGDVTESQRVWRLERTKSRIGSGIIHEGHCYTIGQDGIAECAELKTGNKVWEERLAGPGPKTSSWSSMLLADGRLYVPNQSGDVFVLRASPKFEILATNSVGERTNASLAAADADLFLRTDQALWCLAKPKP